MLLVGGISSFVGPLSLTLPHKTSRIEEASLDVEQVREVEDGHS